jgi:CBS domain-containing protein
VQASDIMTTPVVTVTPDTAVRDTAKCLLDNRISGVPVVDQAGKLVGIVSEGDLMRRPESGTARAPSWWLSLFSDAEAQARAFAKRHGRRVGDVMTTQVVTIDEQTSLEEIADTLEKNRIKRVPVIRNGELVGIVSRADLLHGLAARKDSALVSGDDRTIKQALSAALDQAQIDRRLLKVVVAGGIVRMWGMVDTPEQKDALRVAAETAPGVKAVHLNVDAVPASARAVMWPD